MYFSASGIVPALGMRRHHELHDVILHVRRNGHRAHDPPHLQNLRPVQHGIHRNLRPLRRAVENFVQFARAPEKARAA